MSAPKKLIPRYAYRGSKLPITISGDGLKDTVECDFGLGIAAAKPTIHSDGELDVEIDISHEAVPGKRKVWLIDSYGGRQDPKHHTVEFDVR